MGLDPVVYEVWGGTIVALVLAGGASYLVAKHYAKNLLNMTDKEKTELPRYRSRLDSMNGSF